MGLAMVPGTEERADGGLHLLQHAGDAVSVAIKHAADQIHRDFDGRQ